MGRPGCPKACCQGHEVINKRLLRNIEDFRDLRASCENLPSIEGYTSRQPHTTLNFEYPERYPCVCAYEWHNNDNGPDYYDGGFVYIEDFEGLVTDNKALPMEEN